ncbi:MAG: hypothetical protein WCC70_01150 [Candidatus Aquilonibacter sp.]
MFVLVAPLHSLGEAQNDGTALFQASSSGIRIDRVDLHASGGGSLWWGSECVAVTNVGTLAVSQVTLDFAWTQPNGANESDEIEVLNGPLASGATMGSLTGTVQSVDVCRPTSHGTAAGSLNAQAHVFATSVVYENGTTWSLVPPVAGLTVNLQGSPATLSAVNTYDYAAPRVLTAWHVPADLLPLACSTITSQSEKTITDVRIVYHHLALAGADLGDDVLNVHSTILSHGQGANCRAFVATVQPGLLTYAQNAANGLALQPPVSLYKGSPSVVSVEVTGVAYADGTSWQMPSDHAAPVNSPAPTPSDGPIFLPLPSSGIRINRVYFYADRGDNGIWGAECAAITNLGSSPMMQILLDFAWTRPYGAAIVDETRLFDDPLTASSTLISANQPLAPGGTLSVCGPTFHGILNYAPDAQVQAFVASVVYQNGASWSLVPPVAGSEANVPGSPVTLSSVNTYGYSAPMVIDLRAERTYPIPLACSTIENQTAKTVSDVRIVYRHLATDGTDIGDDQLDVHANIPPQATRKSNCLGFYATMEPMPLAYAQMSQEGPGLEPPVYLYKGVASALSAQVTSVAFADGTSWKSP